MRFTETRQDYLETAKMSNQNIGITEAAKLVGKSPKTLYAAIKAGKMSTSTNIDGQKIVSISEVIRVYGDINKNSDYETALEQGKSGNLEILELKHKLDLLSQENEQLKQRLDDKEKNLEDLRQATKLLTNQDKKISWLARLLGP